MCVIFGGRWFGPSDLYDNDQPKTVAYTVDMVEHGHWLLPVDMLGRPATKPPMYNWLGVPAVAVGWHSEFALKLPSTLAALATVGLTWFAARRTAEHLFAGDQSDAQRYDAFAAVACIALLANYNMVKLCYTARPDMLLTAFLTAGWVLATALLYKDAETGDGEEKDAKPQAAGRGVMQLVLWLCVAGAALTKGPAALLLVIYVLLGGKLLGGRWRLMSRTGIAWGLPLALALVGLWAWGAYASNPEHFRLVFLGDEMLERIGRGGALGILGTVWKMPALFVAKFFPWSVFAIMGAWHVVNTRPRSRWLVGPIGPAMLWVLIVLVFFSLSGGKRADYLAPAYPMASIVAAFWLVVEGKRLLRLRAWQPAAAGLAIALALGAYEWAWSPAAAEGYGMHAVHFARRVHDITGGRHVQFRDVGYTPVQPLLGRNQTPADLAAEPFAPWVVMPVKDAEPLICSEPIWVGGEEHEQVLGLYRGVSLLSHAR